MDGTAAAPPEEVAFGGISRNESMNHDSVHVLFSVINGSKWLLLLAVGKQQRTAHSRPWGITFVIKRRDHLTKSGN